MRRIPAWLGDVIFYILSITVVIILYAVLKLMEPDVPVEIYYATAPKQSSVETTVEEELEESSDSAAGVDSQTESAPSEIAYIINKSSRKFHLPDCSGTKQMKETNRLESDASRDTLIAEGYVPCKICNP